MYFILQILSNQKLTNKVLIIVKKNVIHVMKEMYNFAFMWYTICCVNQVQYFSKEKYIL